MAKTPTTNGARRALTIGGLVGLLGLLITLGGVVGVQCHAQGAIEQKVAHLETGRTTDREETQRLRRELVELERRNALRFEQIAQSLARLETKLETLGESMDRQDRRRHR